MYNAELLKLSKALQTVSSIRLAIFVFSSIILILLFSFNITTPILFIFPISVVSFGIAITQYNKIAFLKKHTGFLKQINEDEIKREECNLEAFDTGQKFMDHEHPYTSDLDIFGEHSIFQMVNRTTTESGGILLTEWLSNPAETNEILERQNSLKELSEKFKWRQDFQASGMHFQNKKSDYYQLLKWVEKPTILLKHSRKYIAASILLSVLSILGLYFTVLYMKYVFLFPFIGIFIVNNFFLKKIRPLAEDIVETSTKNLNTLKGYQALIKKIENESFKSKKVSELQAILTKSSFSAYDEIIKICKILEFSHQKPIKKIAIGGNYIYPLLNSFLLLDIYLIIETEKWKSKNKDFLKTWAHVVSEFEVLNSLAGFCYSNPTYTFPEILEKNNYINFEALGHPLLNVKQRINNDFCSEGQGAVVLITGSNMGGKSTFLRTVGLNLVLASAGAPCCATSGQVSNLKLYTSMRTQDNLKAGVSSFYAELTRIEKMLKLIETNQNVFFLLDEMFKGTNSEDRHRGGFSFINQISTLKASGIVATHDIELAKLSGSKMLVTNYSFNSKIINDSMIFDYKLHPGICNDFNASALMEMCGIKMIR